MSCERTQRGMSIVIALFVIVVVALLAAFAVTVGASQRQSGTVNLQASRALAAARTGLEWGAYRAQHATACNVGGQALALNEGALRGFQVTVWCKPFPHEANLYSSYDITATAEYGAFGSADFVSRTITARYFTPGY